MPNILVEASSEGKVFMGCSEDGTLGLWMLLLLLCVFASFCSSFCSAILKLESDQVTRKTCQQLNETIAPRARRFRRLLFERMFIPDNIVIIYYCLCDCVIKLVSISVFAEMESERMYLLDGFSHLGSFAELQVRRQLILR